MKTIIFAIFFLTASFTVSAQNLKLKVVIEDIKENKGTIFLSLHDNENSFPNDMKKAVKTIQIKTFNTTAEYTFTNLKRGAYAVSVFQDLNENAELDTNFLGIPKEPVGASNMTSFGKPKFSTSKFTLLNDTTIKIQYIN
ncbi:MAG: DUF2141 domain-containing protein [Flavobacterium sp.]